MVSIIKLITFGRIIKFVFVCLFEDGGCSLKDSLGMESKDIAGISVSSVLDSDNDRYGKDRGRLNNPYYDEYELKWDGWVPATTGDEFPIFDVDLYKNLWMTGMRSKGGTHGGETTSYVWKFKVSYSADGGAGHTTLAPVSWVYVCPSCLHCSLLELLFL